MIIMNVIYLEKCVCIHGNKTIHIHSNVRDAFIIAKKREKKQKKKNKKKTRKKEKSI